MQPFREVKVWEKSHQVGLHIYRTTAGFPKAEQNGLTRQMRKSAVMVPSKIAEGCGRSGARDLARYLESAKASANELEYMILLSRDLEYITDEEHGTLIEEITQVQKMLAGFIKAVRGKIPGKGP